MASASYRVTFGSIPQNADWVTSWQIRNSSSQQTYLDLTGKTLRMRLKSLGFGPPLDVDARIIVTDALQGRFEIRVPAAVLAGLEPGGYQHDLVLVDADGARTLIWAGTATITPGVTP